jgi:DNA-binding GntR family transcriptional regulator
MAQRRRNIGDEHQKILDAALARDADKAVKLLAAHLGATTTILLSAELKAPPVRARAPQKRVARA